MSTRSMVCIKQSDKSLKAMYKHWDGYPELMVPFLEKYDEDDKAEELVKFEAVESFMTQEMKDSAQERFSDQYDEDKFVKLSTGDYLYDGDGSPIIYKDLSELWHDNPMVQFVYVWDGYRWIVCDYDALDL